MINSNTYGASLTKYFVYAQPVITKITINAGSIVTSGGSIVIIDGRNFGATAATSVVRFNVSTCAEITNLHMHTYLQCYLPAGQGTVNITVTVGGQVSNGANFTYDPPVVAYFYNQNGPTAGGSTITIKGSNFGLRGFGAVFIRYTRCFEQRAAAS